MALGDGGDGACEILDLHSSGIEGALADSIGGLASLQTLDLHGNGVSGMCAIHAVMSRQRP